MSDRRMDERDTVVWAAMYAASRSAIDADHAVDEYRKRRGGLACLFYDEQDFASQGELIDYLKRKLYERAASKVV